MKVMETFRHNIKNKTVYVCSGCNHSVTVLDNPDELTKFVRNLELRIKELEFDIAFEDGKF